MKSPHIPLVKKGRPSFIVASIASIIITTQTGFAAVGDKVHAFYADEHNTTPTSTTGNRILEIDIENMELVNTLNVPGNLGHHADNGFNSKIYGVPKGSNYVNVIELRKDQNGTTSMNKTKQIELIHKPRSGDAFNDKFNVILMTARNRPMGSFINVDTDEVVGTIGENVDCRLTDGSMLLSHSDANTPAGAMKYQCARESGSHGGDQISGHPYWLTSDYAAVVDRANKQISVYRVRQVGSRLVSTLVNHMPTRTSIHQIVPRDRTSLPPAQQADFYAIEEGEHVNGNDYSTGVAHALIHMKLTTNGLELVKRMDLQRKQIFSKTKADRILNSCISIYRSTFDQALTGPSQSRENQYNTMFAREGVLRSGDQDQYNDFPIDCFYPGIPGGHNADFAPNNKHLYIGMAGGAMSVVDVNRWKIANNIDIGIRTGPGHMCFSEKNNVALSSNHGFSSVFGGASMTRSIRYINSERPIGYYWIGLPFSRENITNTAQSHSCYVDDSGDNYYNFFTDGGVFYKIDLTGVFNNPTNRSSDLVVDSLYTGGIPIQGSYIYVKNIQNNTPHPVFAANNDSAVSNGNAVDIDVMSNDTGDSLILEYADGANNGQVAIVNGKARYTPNSGFSGTDGFWYGISSPGLAWKWAYVDVTVSSTTPPPPTLNAVNDTAVVSPGSSVTIDVLANDSGSNITLGNFGTSWIGTVTKSGNKFIYTADSSFTGTVDFWYAAVDSVGNEDWAKVVITIGGGQIVNNDTATVRQGQSISIDVLDNDRAGLVLTTVDEAWTGVASRSGNSMVYQAPTGFTGDIEVWYGATDASGEEHWALATITVTN